MYKAFCRTSSVLKMTWAEGWGEFHLAKLMGGFRGYPRPGLRRGPRVIDLDVVAVGQFQP